MERRTVSLNLSAKSVCTMSLHWSSETGPAALASMSKIASAESIQPGRPVTWKGFMLNAQKKALRKPWPV